LRRMRSIELGGPEKPMGWASMKSLSGLAHALKPTAQQLRDVKQHRSSECRSMWEHGYSENDCFKSSATRWTLKIREPSYWYQFEDDHLLSSRKITAPRRWLTSGGVASPIPHYGLADDASRFLYQAGQLPLLGRCRDPPSRTSALSQSARRSLET
jgi:hypothetical protein